MSNFKAQELDVEIKAEYAQYFPMIQNITINSIRYVHTYVCKCTYWNIDW